MPATRSSLRVFDHVGPAVSDLAASERFFLNEQMTSAEVLAMRSSSTSTTRRRPA